MGLYGPCMSSWVLIGPYVSLQVLMYLYESLEFLFPMGPFGSY